MYRKVLAAFLAGLTPIAMLCSGCAAHVEYRRATIGGEDALGVAKSSGATRGVVIFFHGMDRDESVLQFDDIHKALVRTLTDAGYAVVSSNAGGNAFGNNASQRDYEELAYNAARHYHVQETYFLAESMGAIAAVNLMAKDNNLKVRGLAAISPLLNFDTLPPAYRNQADSVNSDISSTNPIDLPVASMEGKNFRFYATQTDQLVPTDGNAVAFQAQFGRVASVSVVKCTGEHMDPSCIQGKDIVEWFNTVGSR